MQLCTEVSSLSRSTQISGLTVCTRKRQDKTFISQLELAFRETFAALVGIPLTLSTSTASTSKRWPELHCRTALAYACLMTLPSSTTYQVSMFRQTRWPSFCVRSPAALQLRPQCRLPDFRPPGFQCLYPKQPPFSTSSPRSRNSSSVRSRTTLFLLTRKKPYRISYLR